MNRTEQGKFRFVVRGLSRRPIANLTRWLLAGLLCTAVSGVAHAQISFQNTSSSALEGFTSESWGAAWGDWNGDFWPDLFVHNHRERPSMYRNNGDGTFTNIVLTADTSRAFLSSRSIDHHGIAFADFDGDGDEDFFSVTNGCCTAPLMISQGETFTEEHSARGLPKLDGDANHWLDWNKDGLLDLVSNGQAWVQSAGGNFSSAGFINGCGGNFGLHLTDVTGDGFQEIVCFREGTFPRSIIDFSGNNPVNITSSFPVISNVVDSVVADFDNDQDPDFLFIRGTSLVNQAKQVNSTRIEANLDTSQGQVASQQNNEDAGVTFTGGGVLNVTLNKANGFAGVDVKVGASGPVTSFGSQVVVTLDPNDPATHGIRATTGARDVLIGYDPATNTWQLIQDGASSGWWLIYVQIAGTSGITNLATQGLRSVDLPIRPIYYRNDGGGNFSNQTFASGFAQDIYQCKSAVAEDFDNDRDLDLFFACTSGAENLSNRVFSNNGNGVFTEVSGTGGGGITGAAIADGAGVADVVVSADYDNDGFMDVAVTNGINTQPVRVGGPHQLFRNSGNGNNWIEIELAGTTSNASGIGATILATSGGVTQMREYNGGYHRWSQNHKRAHFGLAANTSADVNVTWPNGTVETFNNVAAGSIYLVTEGSGIAPVNPGPVASLPAAQAGDECGTPAYLAPLDRGLFVYKNCATGRWSVRAVGGFQTNTITFVGDVTTSGAFSNVSPFSLEGSDAVTSGSTSIDYSLQTGTSTEDGFNFDVSSGGSVCLDLNQPGNVPVYLGANHIPISTPLDLATLGACPTGGTATLAVQPLTVDENIGAASVQVTLTPASSSVVTVNFSTQSDTAVGGQDFNGKFQALTFSPGETAKTIAVNIIDDTTVESTESFNGRIFGGSGANIGVSTAPITITDNDSGTPSVAVQPLVVSENSGPAVIEVTLTPASTSIVTVQYSTNAGSAVGGQDYFGTTGTLTFNPGDTSQTYSVTLVNDSVPEATESFTARIFNPSGATMGANTAPVTINDDDSGAATLNVQPLTVSESVGQATVEVTLSPAASSAVTVNYATQAGSAIGGQDFYGTSGSLTFNPGDTSKTYQVTIVNDSVAESTETFNARIFGASGAAIGTNSAPVTINDDDSGASTLAVQPVTVNESAGTATVTVILSPAASAVVTTGYSTNAGTAVGGQDYYGTSGVLTFSPGETSKTYQVTLVNDSTAESQESFTARIFNPSGAAISANTAPVTIDDDD